MTQQIAIAGRGTLAGIAAMQAALAEALVPAGALVLTVEDDAEADLAFLQLIAAARVHAADIDCDFRLSSPANPRLRGLLDRAGFLSDAAPADLDFWFHGESFQ